MSGRLIDADALIENTKNDPVGKTLIAHYNLDGFIKSQPTVDAVPVSELKDTEKERDYWMDIAHSYEKTILRMTISAGEVPVKRGKWELAEDGWYCSACELYPPFDCDPEEKGIPYCPNCGARMDRE